MRKAFTLIEVMISVVIISVVIGALLQMFSNNSHFFSTFKSKIDVAWSSSLIVYDQKIGFEDDSIYLDDLVKKFNPQDDLRRHLNKIKADIIYREVEFISLDEIDTDELKESDTIYETSKEVDDELSSSSLVFEIGKTSFKYSDHSTSFLRLRLQ